MIEDLAYKLSNLQIKKPTMFLLVFGIITFMLLPGIFNLVGNVEPSLEKILPQDIEEVETMNDMRSEFGADMMYLVVTLDGVITDVRDPLILNYMDSLQQKIETYDIVLGTTSLVDEVKSFNNGNIPNTIIEITNMEITPRLVNYDYSLAIIQIKSDTGSSASRIKYLVEAIEDDINSFNIINPGVDVEITGFNAIDKATFEVIMKDFASIMVVSMILIMIVVFLTFKSFTKALMPIIVVMVALLWTMGIVGYLDLTITVVSMVSAAMILGLGIDFGIHVVHTYFENRKNNTSEEALQETLGELLRAMTGASLTTMAGFLALLFGVLPAMKTLAIILALGIFNTLLGAVFLLPVVIYLYDKH